MKDRVFNGFVSGLIAGVVPFSINFGSIVLGLSTLSWADFMGFFITGSKPEGIFEIVFFAAVQFGFLGFLGTVFALILPHISSEFHIFKGALYGLALWLLLFSMPHLLQIPEFESVPFKTAVTHFVSATVWGMVLAFILNKIDSRVSTYSSGSGSE